MSCSVPEDMMNSEGGTLDSVTCGNVTGLSMTDIVPMTQTTKSNTVLLSYPLS
jgi:hypothetical protein